MDIHTITKFNIGDRVYFIGYAHCIMKGTIKEITIETLVKKRTKRKMLKLNYLIKDDNSRNTFNVMEWQLFTNREDLVNEIRNQVI